MTTFHHRQPKANTMLPLEQCDDFLRMPVALRELLLTELAAGNQVVEISHCHPAPPSGACFRLARRLITRAAESNDGLYYRERNSSLSSGEITDGQRFFFLVEPPLPLEPEPDMNAIWERANFGTNPSAPCSEPELESGEQTCSQRFKSSMVYLFLIRNALIHLQDEGRARGATCIRSEELSLFLR